MWFGGNAAATRLTPSHGCLSRLHCSLKCAVKPSYQLGAPVVVDFDLPSLCSLASGLSCTPHFDTPHLAPTRKEMLLVAFHCYCADKVFYYLQALPGSYSVFAHPQLAPTSTGYTSPRSSVV